MAARQRAWSAFVASRLSSRSQTRSHLRAPGEVVDEESVRVEVFSGQVGEVFMVGEEDNLGAVGQLSQHLEGGRGSLVVEADEDIVQH